MQRINRVTIRGLDKGTWREAKKQAITEDITVGDLVTKALVAYLLPRIHIEQGKTPSGLIIPENKEVIKSDLHIKEGRERL